MSEELRDFTSGSSSGEWSLVDANISPKSDDPLSDIEVISNPSSNHDIMDHDIMDHDIMDHDIMDHDIMDRVEVEPESPKLLYSEVLKSTPESDLELVSRTACSELEFDDEEYLNEVLRSTQFSPDQSLSESDESGSSETSDDTCKMPNVEHDMKAHISSENFDEREVVLEVNLTLLSFTILVGVSGMSGFLVGGIYSAVLTNTIPTTTDLSQYPGAIPNSLYKGSDKCEKRLLKMESKMKKLKNYVSRDFHICHNKLKSTLKHNRALTKIHLDTANHASSQCAASRARVEELKSKSSSLQLQLAQQKIKVYSFKRQTRANSAQKSTLNRSLKNTKSDLERARKAVSTLGLINAECSKTNILSGMASSKAVNAAKKQHEETNLWKTMYTSSLADLKDAEEKIDELEEYLEDESEELLESKISETDAKITLLRESHYKEYFKSLARRNKGLLLIMERKYLKVISGDLKNSMGSCSNASVRAEQKASLLTSNREQYRSMKETFGKEDKSFSQLEFPRLTLEQALVKNIGATKIKNDITKSHLEESLGSVDVTKDNTTTPVAVLQSNVAQIRKESSAAKLELEKSRTVIAGFKIQMEALKNHTEHIEIELSKVGVKTSEREMIQNSKNLVKKEEHEREVAALHARYNIILNVTYEDLHSKLSEARIKLDKSTESLNNKNSDLGRLEKRNKNTVSDLQTLKYLKKEQESVRHWKSAVQFNKHHSEKLSRELKGCKSSKVADIANYKKSNDRLMDLLKNVASKAKFPDHTQSVYFGPTYSHSPLKNISITSPSPFLRANVSVIGNVCLAAAEYKVVHRLKTSTGESYSILRTIYSNISSPVDLDTCFSSFSPLFPGVQPRTLADVINMTQTPTSAGKKMSTALAKYWHDVDTTFNKLCKKYEYGDDDWYFDRFESTEFIKYPWGPYDDKDDDDWYFKRYNSGDTKIKYPHGPNNHEAKPKYARGRNQDWFLDGRERKGKYSYVNSKLDRREEW